jgi:diketogulonate reductase-like aldo/keto reductase
MNPIRSLERRRWLQRAGAATLAPLVPRIAGAATDFITRAIPATGERLPVIGMGTWITFDAGPIPAARANLLPVLQAFFDGGGSVIDSSPMYGSSESVLGELLPQVTPRPRPFAASKVWTPGRALGINQMERSRQLWDVPRLDLLQIHNMLDWRTHLPTLREMKTAGRVRYIGITTSHGARHDEIASAIAREPFDFVQFTYSLADRSVERRLLPLAAERGIAVIVNRPFDGGALFRAVRGRPLPALAREIGCTAWSQYFLKFIVSHPAVTCAIPATSQRAHMVENMGALAGPLPDAATRRRMADAFDSA